jgi:hypothetical protein
METQYTNEERQIIEKEMICLICGEKNNSCNWIENEENCCYTFCCQTCYNDKDNDNTGYWGMRGCCKCGEEKHHKLIMSSCDCEKYFNLCIECATENNEGVWYCGEGVCISTD